MSLKSRWRELKAGFVPTFWVANTLELFERFAFYGSKAILTVFLAEKVGLANEAGTLAGIFSGVIYSLPILAGVFVDKYGFKRTLIACFAFFCVGYFLIGMAGMQFSNDIITSIGRRNYVIIVLLLTAIGGSLIKPCIVGTVAKTSKPTTKALGFSIYYTLVNFGGAVGPILAMKVREGLGIEYVLVMSSLTSFFLLLGAFFFFKEPQSENSEGEPRTFRKVLTDMLLVFRNLKFIGFLVIFSGFWLMFWQIFFLLPFYAKDILDFHQFEILEAIDAWCIIFLTIPITALVRKMKPITAMTLGFFFASISWVLIGSWVTVAACIIGISIFALGESMQAPRFYEYVSSLAPKEQIGTYMGFAFLPVAIGAFAAGPIADVLRNNFLSTDPAIMWYIIAGIGLVSTTLMVLYNQFLVQPPAQST